MESFYAKVGEVDVGSVLEADDGFVIDYDDKHEERCLEEQQRVVVKRDEHGLFVPCSEGKHYLDGQIEDGEYIGFFLVDDDD